MNKPKPVIVKRHVKHTFTPDEIAQLNVEFRQAYSNLKAVEADIAAEKSRLKAKGDEAQASMDLKNATLQAGYEMREKECVVIFRPDDKKKDFFLLNQFIDNDATKSLLPDQKPVITEPMVQDDFEQDLIQADSAFNKRASIALWDAGDDSGRLIIGEQRDRWFTALRGNVGDKKLSERLDGEQKSFKNRWDAIQGAVKRLNEWLKVNLGKDASKGFEESTAKAVEPEKEKVE